MLEKYQLHSGKLNEIEPPMYPVARLPFLPVHPAYLCRLCHDNGETYIWRTAARRISHFHHMHQDETWVDAMQLSIEVQTFSEDDATRRDFRVSSALVHASQAFPGDPREVPGTILASAFVKNWESAPPPKPTETSNLKDMEPFAEFSGWGRFVPTQNLHQQLQLLQVPDSGPLKRVLDALAPMFVKLIDCLEDLPRSLCAQVMDETGSGTSSKLHKLQSAQAVRLYGNTWAMSLIYAMRIYELPQSDGSATLQVTFTPSQKMWLTEAWKFAKSKPLTVPVKEVFLGLSISLWGPEDNKHLLYNRFNDPVLRFSIFSNTYASGAFHHPNDISSFLARMKFSMRITTVYWLQGHMLHSQKSEKWAEKHIKATLCASRINPFSSLYDAMGLAVQYKDSPSGQPRAVWGLDQRTMLYVDGQEWHIPSLRNSVGDLIKEIDNGLFKLLGRSTPQELGLHLSPDMKILDRHSNRKPGYSFLNDERNPFLGVSQNLGVHLLSQKEGSILAAGIKDNQIIWRDQGLMQYLSLHQEISNKMMLSWHMSGGQPSRGEEMTTIPLTEQINKGRGIFWLDGRLVYVVQYSKSGNILKSDKAVAHCVPWVLARQFLIMNALVLPFVSQLIKAKFGPEKQAVQEHMAFATMGERFRAETLGDLLEEFFLHRLNCSGVRLNAHRHGVIAMERQFMPTAARTLDRLLATADFQGGHTTNVSVNYYALDGNERYQFLSHTMAKFIMISMLWWPIIMPMDQLTQDELERADKVPQDLNSDDPLVQPSTISTTLELQQLEERIVNKVVNQVEAAVEISRKSIVAEVEVMLNDKGLTTAPATQQGEVAPKALALLQRWSGSDTATWKSPGQGQAMTSILEHRNSLLCILPTGGGKSFLFSSLPLIERRATLVVFPLKALYEDQTHQWTKQGIEWADWTPHLVPVSGLVAVQLQAFLSIDVLMQWCHAAIGNQALERIIFDEAHTALTQAHFREEMKNICCLVELAIPVIALSATVPPIYEERLQTAFGRPQWQVIRETTQRANIQFRIAKFHDPNEALRSLRHHINHFKGKLGQGEVMLVHCRTRALAIEAGNHLNIPVYHSKLTDATKQQILTAWMDGNAQELVSTMKAVALFFSLGYLGEW
ncbi:hypothetical protein RhiTH_008941 [Rhizoctonia solani]